MNKAGTNANASANAMHAVHVVMLIMLPRAFFVFLCVSSLVVLA
jgi:hypothetical protein